MAGPLMITDADINGVLKNVYASYRVNAFPKLTPLLAQVEKAKPGGPEMMKWSGNGVFWDVVLTRPVGMSADDQGWFPPHAQATEKQATLGIKRTYVTREIDALAIAGTTDKVGAFIPFVRKIMQEAMDAAQLGQQEVLHGDGRGVKGLITTVNSTTEIIVSSPYGLASAGQGGLLLDVGMFIAVLDTGSADAILGTSEITGIVNNGDSVTLTLGTAISGMAATDKVVAASTATRTSFNAVPNGLLNITNRGGSFNLFEGINAGTFGRWNALNIQPTDPANPNEMDVWTLAQRVAGRSGKDAKMRPSEFLLLTTPGIEKRLAESFLGQRRFEAGANLTLKGGFKAININGIGLVSDYWCPAGTLYLLHLPSLTWVDRQDWVKLQFEGSGPWRFMSGRDAYQVNFGSYWNFGALNRITHGVYTGYTDAERYTHVV